MDDDFTKMFPSGHRIGTLPDRQFTAPPTMQRDTNEQIRHCLDECKFHDCVNCIAISAYNQKQERAKASRPPQKRYNKDEVLHVYYDSHTLHEAAETLGVPESRAKSFIIRALGKNQEPVLEGI